MQLDVDDIKRQIASISGCILSVRHRYDVTKSMYVEEVIRLKDIYKKRETVDQAYNLVLKLVREIQVQMHTLCSHVVTKCLQVVFGKPFEFEIRFAVKANRTEPELILKCGDMYFENLLEEVGGGVVDVISFALRLCKLLIARPSVRKLLVLDEPWKNVRGERYRSYTKQVLCKVVEEFGFQVLINTDISEYQAGKVYRFCAGGCQ